MMSLLAEYMLLYVSNPKIQSSNKEKIEVTKEGYKLMNGDKIRFGLQQHVFTVVYVPLITALTTFQASDKQKLQGIFHEIDGMISHEWISACTHLTVSKATLTEKVMWAMASAIPIVSLNYWVAVKLATNNGEKLPDPSDFIPPLKESLISKSVASLSVNEKRKTLFRNLIFVHFSAHQYKAYGRMIMLAGGKSLLYSKKPLTIKQICAPNVIVLKHSDDDQTQSTRDIVPEYETIYKSLQMHKRNMIAETDIVLAILHCSTEKYCNPKFNFSDLLKRPPAKSDSSKVIVLDTQDLTPDVRVLPKVISNISITSNVNAKKPAQRVEIIPETCDSYKSTGDMPEVLDIVRSNSSKQTQITKIVTSDIVHDRKFSESFKEIYSQETVEIIPETNNLIQTQDILKPSTSAGSILNNKSRIERAKQVPSQKTVKYIPETNDLSQSQDIISSSNINQDIKSTSGNDISIQSKLPQRIKEVHPQRTVQCIPETNDLFESQETLTNRLPSTSQGTKNISNSNSSIGSKSTVHVNDIHPRGTPKCIPETNESSLKSSNSNSSIGSKSTVYVNDIHPRGTPKCIPETNESSLKSSNSNSSIGSKSTVHVNDIHPRGTPKCIPETNESSLKSSHSNSSIGSKSIVHAEDEHPGRTPKCIPEANESSRKRCNSNSSDSNSSIGNKSVEYIEDRNKETILNDVIDLANGEDDPEEAENRLVAKLHSTLKANEQPQKSKLVELIPVDKIRAQKRKLDSTKSGETNRDDSLDSDEELSIKLFTKEHSIRRDRKISLCTMHKWSISAP
ncbi:nibrin isoform X2 [Augochlora pura]